MQHFALIKITIIIHFIYIQLKPPIYFPHNNSVSAGLREWLAQNHLADFHIKGSVEVIISCFLALFSLLHQAGSPEYQIQNLYWINEAMGQNWGISRTMTYYSSQKITRLVTVLDFVIHSMLRNHTNNKLYKRKPGCVFTAHLALLYC